MPLPETIAAPAPVTPNVPPSGVRLNLISALAATDAQNPLVEIARWRVQEAYAQAMRANTLWLPHLRAGIAYNRHEGAIQDVAGNVFDTSRGGYQLGLGPHAVGQGSPAIPGVWMQFHAADALWQPTIAASAAEARNWSAQTASSDALLETATYYLELLRADQEAAIARDLVAKSAKLADLTGAYAKAGQGLESDFDRARTELSLRQNDVLRAEEAAAIASTRLATQLRFDPAQRITVDEPAVVPIDLVSGKQPVAELVAEGLIQRSEVAENRWLVNEAAGRLKREQYAPLLPSMLLGLSYNGLSGGVGTNAGPLRDRFDADAIAYWELRNFGYGDRAAQSEACARVEQARWREIAALDRVAREIIEAHTRVESRRKQIALAQQAVKAAEDSYRRNLLRAENSQGLPIETLQSISALGLAQRDYLRAVSDFNLAQFQLLRALGGGSPKFLAGL
jgi:outer membrane protein TolC